MNTQNIPCPFCGGKMTPIMNGNARRNVIHGWECSRANCQFSPKYFSGNELEHRNLKKILMMQARIEKLENSSIVWRKYPEEKPADEFGRKAVAVANWDQACLTTVALYSAEDDTFIVNGYAIVPQYWAYLPQAPTVK